MPVHVYRRSDGSFLMARDDGRCAPRPGDAWRFAPSAAGQPSGWVTRDEQAARTIASRAGTAIESPPSKSNDEG